MTVAVTRVGVVTVVTIDRPEVRNAVDRLTAQRLADAFRAFESDPASRVAVLTGAGGTFCAGADLHAIAQGRPNRLEPHGDAPMGPSRMVLGKPVIAAVAGHAVAGGLELACWADLRVVESDAVLGVFCRAVGVPLIDGGTVRLPRIVGLGRALDLILTGRPVNAQEALRIGLADRVVEPGTALAAAVELAGHIASQPQAAMLADRSSVYAGLDLPLQEALAAEFAGGLAALPEAVAGAGRFSSDRALGQRGEP
jgi:enoyl-CoA hydratase